MAEPLARVVTTALDDDRPLLELPWADAAWVREGQGLVGTGTATRFDAGTGPERFERAAARLAEYADRCVVEDEVGVPGGGVVALASFTFADDRLGSTVHVPAVSVGRADGRTWLTRVVTDDRVPDLPTAMGPAPARDRVRYAGSSIPDHLWLGAVAEVTSRIAAGAVDKVVLARDVAVWSREPFDPRWVVARLATRFPSCFTFLVDGLVGATPELLVRRTGSAVTSRVLAGTTARSRDPGRDADLGRALLASDKDGREHALAARSVHEALVERCSELESVGPELLVLDNLQHLSTTFQGALATPSHVLELAGELHPTAAVGGWPRPEASALITELEGMDRGRYAGPVGVITPDGDGELAIALRCAELSGARARLFAGAGIVAGSLPEDELEETRLKLRAMQGALADPAEMGADG